MTSATFPVSNLPLTSLGRWSMTERSLVSSWVSATIRFRCVACGLAFVPGPSSGRYEAQRADSGIKMLVVHLREGPHIATLATDVEPGVETTIFAGEDKRDVEVEIRLADWSATLEIASFSLTDGQILPSSFAPAPHRFLFIGDSITSGWCDAKHHGSFERGVDHCWPYALSRELGRSLVDIEVVAYPWMTLVDNVDSDSELGMESKFWHTHARESIAKWSGDGDKSTVAFIAMGVNDNETSKGTHVPENVFLKAVTGLVSNLKDRLGSLKHIVVMTPWPYENGPLPNGLYEPALRDTVLALGRDWSESGSLGPKLHHLATFGWYGDDGDIMDGCHPTAAGHTKIGVRLAQWCRTNGILV